MTNKRKLKRFRDSQKPTYARIKVVDVSNWHGRVFGNLVDRLLNNSDPTALLLKEAMAIIDGTRIGVV